VHTLAIHTLEAVIVADDALDLLLHQLTPIEILGSVIVLDHTRWMPAGVLPAPAAAALWIIASLISSRRASVLLPWSCQELGFATLAVFGLAALCQDPTPSSSLMCSSNRSPNCLPTDHPWRSFLPCPTISS
jgi:hypothetical protein